MRSVPRYYYALSLILLLMVGVFVFTVPVSGTLPAAGNSAGQTAATADPDGDAPLFPSDLQPDNIVIACGATPARMLVNWRTSAMVRDGWVEYKPADGGDLRRAEAVSSLVVSEELAADTHTHTFSAVMNGLEPGTDYRYRVGSARRDAWSDWLPFQTVPDHGNDLTFVYLGDVQGSAQALGRLLEDIAERHPDTNLYLAGGDFVEEGDSRNQWDEIIQTLSPFIARTPMLPTVGNHDVTDEHDLYSRYFIWPDNGLKSEPTCKNYYFTAGDVFFIVLDANFSKSRQKAWLKRTLKKARNGGYAFTVAMFHKPMYHPRAGRSSDGMIKHWLPLFERYGVDLVLTGHDHSYLRTRKMRGGRPVPDSLSGTVHVVANTSEKHYPFEPLDIAAAQFTDIPTYQVVRVTTPGEGPAALHYAAYGPEGEMLDAFSLTAAPGIGTGEGGYSVPSLRKMGLPIRDHGNGVAAHGRLRTQGTDLVNERGEAVQLRGLSSHGIHWYPQFTTIGALLDIKARGANLFRVAMYADSDNNGYNASSRDRRLNKRLLRMAVENALAADLYTIIDWHLLRDETPLRHADRAVAFFDEMSRLYGDSPAVMYEICNEPNGPTTWEAIAAYAERVIPVIRRNAPDAVIIVGTPKYSSDILSPLAAPLPYDNIMYAYHMYTGYTDYEFRSLLDTARQAGLPVFVSEWGISKEKGNDEHDLAEGLAFLHYMHEYQISWAYWALCNADRDYVVIRQDSQALGDWHEEDLTIPGKIIFSALENGLPR